jgi:hypothetical protein
MTAYGPSRHFAAAQQLGRFWREADINRQAEPTGLVANDPEPNNVIAAYVSAPAGERPDLLTAASTSCDATLGTNHQR